MSVEKRLFLGIKQMTQTAFSELQDSEKVGYIWFVRCEDPVHFEIYLGTKKYGETNETVEQFIREIAEKLRAAIGLNEDLTLPEDFQNQDLIAELNDHGVRISEIEEKIVGLFKFKGVFDTLTELFASGETVDGYIYQVVYRDIEQNEEGVWVPVISPVLINSEFIWNGSEWVELGPVFDDRELKKLEETVSNLEISLESETQNRIDSDTEILNEFHNLQDITREQIDALFGGSTKVEIEVTEEYSNYVKVSSTPKYANDGDIITLSIELKPESSEIYEFDAWYVDGVKRSTNNNYTTTFSKTSRYEAKVKGKTIIHTLTFASNDETMGYAYVNEIGVREIFVNNGDGVTFTPIATPNSGYKFDDWSGGLVDRMPNTITNVTSDATYYASFSQIQPTATVVFEGSDLNITGGSKTVGGVTLTNVNGMTYNNGLYASGSGKVFSLSTQGGLIEKIEITMTGTNNRYQASGFTNTNGVTVCTSCVRDNKTHIAEINHVDFVNCKNNGGAVTIIKLEITLG